MKSDGSGRSKKAKGKCKDFEGLWKGIDPEDYSVILASITCVEDSAIVVGNDSKWGDGVCSCPIDDDDAAEPAIVEADWDEPVCDPGPLQAGGYTKEYELVDGILSSDGEFEITCEDGNSAGEFGFPGNFFPMDFDGIKVSTYELQPNGSLSFDDFAILWKQSSD